MLRKLSLLICTTLIVTACGSKMDKEIHQGKPLVKIGDDKIHEGYIDFLGKMDPKMKKQLEMPGGKKAVVDKLVDIELLYQQSLSRGLDKSPELQKKLEFTRRTLIAQALIDDEADKIARKDYETNKDKEFTRVKLAHIFFSTMPKPAAPQPGKPPAPISDEDRKKAEQEASEKAKTAYDRLKNGEAWDVVVKEVSDDKPSADRGGDMGYVTQADRRLERLDYKGLVDKAFALKVGEYSEPIPAKDGWHIIKVIEDKSVQPYEDVAMILKGRAQASIRGKFLEDLKKNKVQYLDETLAESAPAPTANPHALPVPPKTPPVAPDGEKK